MSSPHPHSSQTIQGYHRTLSGTTMNYPSPLPDTQAALICRASDGNSAISWESAPVTVEPGQKEVALIWLAGLGCNLGEKRFTLSVNGRQQLVFTTSFESEWTVAGDHNSRLVFRTLSVDRYGDHFGFMQLYLSAQELKSGEPLTLHIQGEAAGSTAWVMTYQANVAESISLFSPGLLLRGEGEPSQPLEVVFIHLGAATVATIQVDDLPPQKIPVKFGVTRDTLKLKAVKNPVEKKVHIELDGVSQTRSITLKPVKPWTVYLVQHTHTDIGYTRPQTDILAEHVRYIDYALDYCDQTDTYPDDAKFRWTCETSWAVREYLKTRPAAQIARLKKRVQEGRIEITAQLLNWAEVADENALRHSLEPVRAFKNMGFPVHTAMQNDVNGYAWCLVDYFSELGIKYVTSGINTHRAMKPFAVPTAFWWESPSGKRVLAYRADHYMTGNLIGLLAGPLEPFEDGLSHYLDKLVQDGYSYDFVSMQFSGYGTDNAPPSTTASELIRKWNDKYIYPRLKSATAHEFLEQVEQRYGSHLDVYRAAWPDWWTDGYGCAMRETAAGRTTQADLLVNQGLLAMARLQGAQISETTLRRIDEVAEMLNFYNEHTFGAAESITDPLVENSQVQWSEKSSYVWQAVMQSRLLKEAAMGQLQSFLAPADVPTLVVFNTLNWARSGLHVVYMDNQILPKDAEFHLIDENGIEIDVQAISSRAEGNHWALWVEDIPALGYKTYRIMVEKKSRPLPPAFTAMQGVIKNVFYEIEVDAEKGAIRRLFDRELGCDLLDPQRQWQLGEFIYERLADRHPMEELRLGDHTRTVLANTRIEPGVDGPIWQSLIIKGTSAGFTGEIPVQCELRMYKRIKRIELLFKARKSAVTDPEAVYVAFPFGLAEGRLFFEAQGGEVSPGANQLQGTATDWNTVQNYARVRNDKAQIVLVSDEVPLMQFGAINTGRYQRDAKPQSQQIFSWVLNNYWTTNFRAAQEGEITWTYVLTSTADNSSAYASRFGWGVRTPFATRVLPATPAPRPGAVNLSLWPFKSASILLVASTPGERGVLLQLREIAGQPAVLELSDENAAWKLEETDALGLRARAVRSITFKPYEVKYVRLWK